MASPLRRPGGNSRHNNRIQVFESDGSVRRKWGGPLGLGIPGWWPGWFRYIVDFGQDRIVMFQEENIPKERVSSLSVSVS